MATQPSARIHVRVHPNVLFTIVDAHDRRPIDRSFVLGALLGKVEKDSVEVTDCYRVRHHDEIDTATGERKFTPKWAIVDKVVELHRSVFNDDELLGWFCTTEQIQEPFALVHFGFYCKMREKRGKNANCIFLTVNCQPTDRSPFQIKAYTVEKVRCGSAKDMGSIFVPCDVSIDHFPTEKVAIEALMGNKNQSRRVVPLLDESEQILNSYERINRMLNELIDYVKKVLKKTSPADSKIGRMISELVHSVPQMKPDQFDAVVNATMKDLLLILYLNQLTKTPCELMNAAISL